MSNDLEKNMPNLFQALSNIDNAVLKLEEKQKLSNNKLQTSQNDNENLKKTLKAVADNLDKVISRFENITGD